MTQPAEKRAEPTLGLDRLLAEHDRLKAANAELVDALAITDAALRHHPGGDNRDNADSDKATAVLAKHGDQT